MMSRYNFCLKARLKTGMDFLGQDLGIQVANPPTKNSQEYPCWGRISEWVSITFKMLSVSVKWST